MSWFNPGVYFPITDPTWIFFLVLSIILFAPMLLDRLRIPAIVGMIFAGVIIGPHGLRILEYDSSFELFGKVGLYYIMFLASLEMDMQDLQRIRGKAITLGLLAFIFPLGLGIVSNIFLLKYGLITSILLASMYASHTLISYPIVIRYGVARHQSVSIAVGGTIVTDTFTLLVLAVISGMFKGDTGGMFWFWLIAKVLILGGLIVYSFPRIGRWFFRRYNSTVMQYIFVLVMVFLSAGLMQVIGLEGILGVFLAGLVLNRLIPSNSPLMSYVKFVGNALFIPYFLIGVGMIIDIRILVGHIDSLKVAAVMIVIALSGKWIASWLTQKIYGMSNTERELMFGLSNAQAAATLAAVLVGYSIIMPNGERLLNDDVLNGTVLLILVTCIVSSLITERQARRLALSGTAGDEEAPDTKNEKMLIALSNPDTVDTLVTLALMLRKPKQKNGLVGLSVVYDNDAGLRRQEQSRKNLEIAMEIAASVNVDMQVQSRVSNNIASGIIHAMKEFGATELILGLHRKSSIVDSFFGILTNNILKDINRQVIIVKCLIPVNTLRRIVVAVPEKAEYEVGFYKWVERLGRLGEQIGCRIHFWGHPDTLRRIEGFLDKYHKSLRTEFSTLSDWNDLLILTGQINYDYMLVIVSARSGSISYQPSFEHLPEQILHYFSNNSLMIIYPDQYGDDSVDNITFIEPNNRQGEMSRTVENWVNKWFRN